MNVWVLRSWSCLCLVGLAALGCSSGSSDPKERGRELYLNSCAPCHGERADGNGPRAAVLDPKPRDYTDPEWRAKATFESVLEAVRNGVPGSAMPSWDILSESDLEAVSRYVLVAARDGEAEN